MYSILSSRLLKQLCVTFGASLAYLIIGLVRGYSSSALPSMQLIDADLIETEETKSWVGAIPPLGAFFGSLASGKLMGLAGRKRALQITAPLWTASWIIIACAVNIEMVLLGRILTGFCVGLTLACAQVYVSECCDADIRGRLSSLPTFFMSGGILMSYIIGYWLQWRDLAWCSAGACVALFAILLPLPESPVWLENHNHPKESLASTQWLQLAQPEKRDLDKDDEHIEPEVVGKLFTRKVFFSSVVIKPLTIGFTLLIFQQISGIDSVIFYTVEIFNSAGSSLNGSLATIVVGVVQLLCNGVSTLLIDRTGRRPLLMISGAITAVAMCFMGLAFHIQFEKHSLLGYLPLASLILFMVGFSLGFGGIPFVLLGEIFPAKYRSSLSALAGSVNLLTMFAVIKTYHVFQVLITSAGTFWMYSSFCALSVVFVALFVPETKGKSLEDIERHFRSKPKKSPKELEVEANAEEQK